MYQFPKIDIADVRTANGVATVAVAQAWEGRIAWGHVDPSDPSTVVRHTGSLKRAHSRKSLPKGSKIIIGSVDMGSPARARALASAVSAVESHLPGASEFTDALQAVDAITRVLSVAAKGYGVKDATVTDAIASGSLVRMRRLHALALTRKRDDAIARAAEQSESESESTPDTTPDADATPDATPDTDTDTDATPNTVDPVAVDPSTPADPSDPADASTIVARVLADLATLKSIGLTDSDAQAIVAAAIAIPTLSAAGVNA